MTENIGVYIHIPFCRRKCAYCDFYSITSIEEYRQKYIESLCSEILEFSKKTDKTVDTVYIGGGTPSLLSIKELSEIYHAVYNNFRCDIREFTVEVNPDSADNIGCFSDFGVNRLSVGVQSNDDEILRKLGRLHDFSKAERTMQAAAKYFDNVSADLIIGVEQFQDIYGFLKTFSPYIKHLSAYMLQIEEGTPLYADYEKGCFSPADDEDTASQYSELQGIASDFGFFQYEISNFALPGYESLHNLKYWNMSEYVGFGAAAHSFCNGKRFYNKSNIDAYIKDPFAKEYEDYSPEIEGIILPLRTTYGLNIDNYNKKFNVDFLRKYEKALYKLKDSVFVKNGVLSIKPQYYLLLNSILTEFI